MSIRIVRRHPRGGQPPAETASRWTEDFEALLLRRVEDLHAGLRGVHDPGATGEQWRYLDLHQDLPRSLWLRLLHAAVADDYLADLETFAEELEPGGDPTEQIVLSINRRPSGAVWVSLIDPGYMDPIHIAAAPLERFFDRERWRELTRSWTQRELLERPGRAHALLRRAASEGRG